MDAGSLENLVTPATRAIVCMHYAGVACEMTKLKKIAKRHGLFLVEDAAHAIYSTYRGKALGSFGDLSAFSFHETKNIISGEGGLLCVNNRKFARRSEIIWEKGTNRAAFYRGEVNKYGWVDIGSSFLPSELTAAFLWAQVEKARVIQHKRLMLWNEYYKGLLPAQEKGFLNLPYIPEYASNNAHMFYFMVEARRRNDLISYLKRKGVHAVWHYLPLHQSRYYRKHHKPADLPNSTMFSRTIVRLPLYFSLSPVQCRQVIKAVRSYFE